jgi:zinc and cadmium transporter
MSEHALFNSFISAVGVSLVSLVGVATLPLRGQKLNQITFVLISLATGALFGDAVFHILPDVFKEHAQQSSFWIMVGIFSSFVFEKFLRWKHEHGIAHSQTHTIQPVGRIILVADGLHNLIDGIFIGASYIASLKLGLATTLAVVLHEIPHEMGDFAVLINAGYSWEKALLFNFLSACVAITGVFVAFGFQAGVSNFTNLALALTAGSFLYIAGANLTPELHKENAPVRSLIQCVAILAGTALMYALLWIE